MGLIERLIGPNVDKLLARGDLQGLTRLLGHERPQLRARAVGALAELDDSTAVEHLVAALGDPDDGVATAVSSALQHFADRATASLGAALGNDQEVIGKRALGLLLQLDPPPAETLVEACQGGNDRARTLAPPPLAELLPRLDGEVKERGFRALLAALGDRRPETRSTAAGGLGELADARAAKALTAQLKDGTETVRAACADALQRIGPPVLPYLVDALGDRNANARAGAARLLGLVAADADRQALSEASERLQEAAADRDPKVREQASAAMQRLGMTQDREPSGE